MFLTKATVVFLLLLLILAESVEMGERNQLAALVKPHRPLGESSFLFLCQVTY